MLEGHNKRDKTHLINLIIRRSNSTPNFALLIGAGGSVSSGVRPTYKMIDEWRLQLHEQSKSEEPFEKWLLKQDWYKDEEEYSILFEKVYDQRSQRRIYIEECVKDARPSWGYIYLSNLIAHDYFNVVFTPNFDDLLHDTCFLYADLRPIVCAHDSAVADIRVTSARPKIIKLHGDFLYDSIKNTIRETETLEKNMRDKFMQFGREYGLVVIGYGGNDRSIMDILNTMLASGNYFPNGVYWCIRNKASKKLNRLMRQDNIYWVEIDGFDEFMAELHKCSGLALPTAVRDPFKETTEKMNRFILTGKNAKNPIIRSDIAKLAAHMKRFERIVSGKAPREESARLIPYLFLGETEYNHGKYEDAIPHFENALTQDPQDATVREKLYESYLYTGKYDKAVQLSERGIDLFPERASYYYDKVVALWYARKLETAIETINKAIAKIPSPLLYWCRSTLRRDTDKVKEALPDAEKALALDPSDNAFKINKAMILKRLDRVAEAKELFQEVLKESKSKYNLACTYAGLNDKKNMLNTLKKAIKEKKGRRVDARFDPDFADYREDPDFQKLVMAQSGKKRKVKEKSSGET